MLRENLFVIPAALLFLGVRSSAQDPSFIKECPLPRIFAKIAPPTDPFAPCGNCGVTSVRASPSEAAAKSAESKAKNNFCGNLNTVTVVDFAILANMQARSDKANLKANLGNGRQKLKQFFPVSGQKIGEGSVVRLKAFVKEAHISDCDGGEEVNCKKTGPMVNDIHIPLVDPTVKNPRTQDECASVTAEINPHFRPDAWAQFDMKTPVNNPVRVTGPLFFDNSHDPCTKNPDGTFHQNRPARISLWEIHPVYAIDVCANSDPQKCDITNDGVWTPYDQWLGSRGSMTEATGQKIREECQRLNGTPSKPVEATRPLQCAAATRTAQSPKHPKRK